MTTHPKLDVPSGRLVGAIVCESLRPGAVIEVSGLVTTKLSRYDIDDPAAGQPSRWTLLEFDGPADAAGVLADQLAAALLVEGGWYANFSTTSEVFIVYARMVFRYDRATASGRAGAEEYGRSMGVPEPQLDWAE